MTSSSGKRYKTIGTKRKDKEPEHTHSSKFLSRKHEKHFKIVQDRRLLMERKAGLIPDLAPQFGEQMVSDHPAKDYLSYVRGNVIRYDPDSINRFLDTEWVGEQCQFALNLEEGTYFDDVESVLCVLGGNFQRNMNGAVVIANEIQVCANTTDTKAPLGHPSLITHLCELAGLNIYVPPFERPRKSIDEAYYRQYCGVLLLDTIRLDLSRVNRAHRIVYKVVIGPDKAFAMKKIRFTTSQGKNSSTAREIQTLGKIRHRNLVKLEDFWLRKDCGLILYSYMANGSLHDVLHERAPTPTLKWNVWYKIAVGIAHGLAYLHYDCDPPIVHRDIKPSNILLDSDMVPHIADFGIAKLLEQSSPASNTSIAVHGTIGYIAPENAYATTSSRESDVYIYGVFLLELITRKKATVTYPSYEDGVLVD
ncbi:hypothetical protein LR48_Vigan07g123600 [Vigna angularis]|uniref:non-specific serine/threonine protein kinase n=1 Tax=Phaseolus angularis TaxID=3914 RepID=A0A0L9UY76_PHAAN|nr:hypothetical protein LR48_Vigan07g123600 [Vigna angularis]